MSFVRKASAPVASVVAGIALLFGGAPADLVGIAAASVGQLVQGMVPSDRSRAEVVADVENHANLARAYEAFGASVALTWQAAGVLCTFRPRFVGYVHSLALLMRAQRRFEEESSRVTAALGSVLLYGSSETQEAALEVFKRLGDKLTEIGHGGAPGSRELARTLAAASLDLGDAVVMWRRSAQADLAGHS